LPETGFIALDFAADSLGTRLLLFTQISLKLEPSESKSDGTKSEFDMKIANQGHSKSLI